MSKHLAHIIRYRDQNTPSASCKPPGVTLIQIYANVGDAIDHDVCTARSVGDYGRQPIRIEWPPAHIGQTVTYFGRWMTKKGLKGPWSLPVYMTVAGGGRVAEPMTSARRAGEAGADHVRRAA